jgi:hemolysin activation/secretion protein
MSKKLLTAALLALSQTAFAQSTPLTSGGQIQQIPPAPSPQRAMPEIRIEQGGAPATPESDSAKILVQSLNVTGQTLYSEAQLLALTGFKPGTELTLGELRTMATKIADHYRQAGYFVAQAYLPAQNIKDGAVTITVIEGRYGQIALRNQSTLRDSVANNLLQGLNPGDPIAIVPLENRLLLLSDVPGINVKSTLAPGVAIGASDLFVDVTDSQRVTGSVEADNAGNYYTGEYRVGGTVNINNPTGHGDMASLRVLTSGQGLKYGRLSYQTLIGKATVGIAYTALEYRLGKEFASLNAHGTVEIASLYGSYPLIRSRNTNLYALAGYDDKTFQDRIDTTSTVTDKKAQVYNVGLAGNHRDSLGGGGLNTYSLTGTFGDIDIRTPAALAVDAATARTNGSFNKLGFTAARLQNVTERVSLYAGIYGQVASKNLDISEKMGLGGPYAVRSYPVGEAYGDEGYVVNLEARYLLSNFAGKIPGQLHLIGFADAGSITINSKPWTNANNHRNLSAAGVGLTWADYNNFTIKTYYGWKLGNEAATSAPDKSGRFWIQAIKYF